MTHRQRLIVGLAIVAAVIAVPFVVHAQRQAGPVEKMKANLQKMFVLLKATDAQKAQVKTVMVGHQAEIESLLRQAVAAKLELDDAIWAAPNDAPTIREKAARLASFEADGAVLRGRIHAEILAELTPDQRQRAETLRKRARDLVEAMLSR